MMPDIKSYRFLYSASFKWIQLTSKLLLYSSNSRLCIIATFEDIGLIHVLTPSLQHTRGKSMLQIPPSKLALNGRIQSSFTTFNGNGGNEFHNLLVQAAVAPCKPFVFLEKNSGEKSILLHDFLICFLLSILLNT